MRFRKALFLIDCLGLKKVDRFYYEEPPTTTPPSGSAPTTATTANTVDLSKLSDEEFAKVFDDPRLFNHERFKTLAQAKKERDTLAQEKTDREKKELEAKGEYEKLAKTAEAERDSFKTKYEQATINNAIIAKAATLGAVDMDAVIALINKGEIKVDESGTITGIEEALKTLSESKKYLFDQSKAQTRIGSPTTPGKGNTGTGQFTRSQIQDAKFFREHEADIKAAMIAGQIIDDRSTR